MQKRLILGSSSRYRKALLERLNLPFECISPDIDEAPLEKEAPKALVERLAKEKAKAIFEQIPNTQESIIITSDQVACLDGQILGKPLTRDNAIKHLSLFSGKKVEFLTSLCVTDSKTKQADLSTSLYSVYFRKLNLVEIEGYVDAEQPLDCAGSFKCEGLGVALFEKMEGDDPNSLIGLPLIKVSKSLSNFGLNPLTNQAN